MQQIHTKVKITNCKNGLSKDLDLKKYTPFKARCIFDFYANHKFFMIELI